MSDIYDRLKDATQDDAVGACEAALQSLWARDEEIERLKAHIAEIEKWKDEGERIIGPAAEWGPGGNVRVQSSTLFKLGAWWADRPWRVREALGDD